MDNFIGKPLGVFSSGFQAAYAVIKFREGNASDKDCLVCLSFM